MHCVLHYCISNMCVSLKEIMQCITKWTLKSNVHSEIKAQQRIISRMYILVDEGMMVYMLRRYLSRNENILQLE